MKRTEVAGQESLMDETLDTLKHQITDLLKEGDVNIDEVIDEIVHLFCMRIDHFTMAPPRLAAQRIIIPRHEERVH